MSTPNGPDGESGADVTCAAAPSGSGEPTEKPAKKRKGKKPSTTVQAEAKVNIAKLCADLRLMISAEESDKVLHRIRQGWRLRAERAQEDARCITEIADELGLDRRRLYERSDVAGLFVDEPDLNGFMASNVFASGERLSFNHLVVLSKYERNDDDFKQLLAAIRARSLSVEAAKEESYKLSRESQGGGGGFTPPVATSPVTTGEVHLAAVAADDPPEDHGPPGDVEELLTLLVHKLKLLTAGTPTPAQAKGLRERVEHARAVLDQAASYLDELIKTEITSAPRSLIEAAVRQVAESGPNDVELSAHADTALDVSPTTKVTGPNDVPPRSGSRLLLVRRTKTTPSPSEKPASTAERSTNPKEAGDGR